jgi:hypothetical protein
MHPAIIKAMAAYYASIIFDYFILLSKEGEENQCRKAYNKIWPADGSSSNLETPNPIILTFMQVKKNKHFSTDFWIFRVLDFQVVNPNPYRYVEQKDNKTIIVIAFH